MSHFVRDPSGNLLCRLSGKSHIPRKGDVLVLEGREYEVLSTTFQPLDHDPETGKLESHLEPSSDPVLLIATVTVVRKDSV